MNHVTISVKVGRAETQPLASFSFDGESSKRDAELACDAVQVRKSAELAASGVAPERVSFQRDYVVHASVAAKKGKK